MGGGLHRTARGVGAGTGAMRPANATGRSAEPTRHTPLARPAPAQLFTCDAGRHDRPADYEMSGQPFRSCCGATAQAQCVRDSGPAQQG
eukprot:2049484-Alexandrium_andersonii.AAC.1